jgi:hypothetical protein
MTPKNPTNSRVAPVGLIDRNAPARTHEQSTIQTMLPPATCYPNQGQKDATTYTLTLTPTPGDVPPEIRLRRLLKTALRVYGLRCVSVSQTHVSETGVILPDVLDRPAPTRTGQARGQ